MGTGTRWGYVAATVWQYGSRAATAGQYESWPEVITGAGVSNKLPPIVPFSEAASYNSHTAAPWHFMLPLHGRTFVLWYCVVPLHGRTFVLWYCVVPLHGRTFVWGWGPGRRGGRPGGRRWRCSRCRPPRPPRRSTRPGPPPPRSPSPRPLCTGTTTPPHTFPQCTTSQCQAAAVRNEGRRTEGSLRLGQIVHIASRTLYLHSLAPSNILHS